jgi:hypothetical protein
MIFERPKPQYENIGPKQYLNILDLGVRNDGTWVRGNAGAFNMALQVAKSLNQVLIIPAGVYLVEDTINIPVGSRIVGILWPQIMAFGSAFSDMSRPKVLAR